MRIIMTKRKPGIYAQWFVVFGINEKGDETHFLIYHHQAKNYSQAVRFWKDRWGKTCTAHYLKNAEPFSQSNFSAC